MNIEKTEKSKYSQIWANMTYQSSRAERFAKYVIDFLNIDPPDRPNYTILEVGCGNGTTLAILQKAGFNVFGLDIVARQIPRHIIKKFRCAPVWDTGFADKQFAFTISTDVMEHLPPEMVIPSITELQRITGLYSLHAINTKPDSQYCGHHVHLSVHDIQWWEDQFSAIFGDFSSFWVVDTDKI